jgi:hypothetical protein
MAKNGTIQIFLPGVFYSYDPNDMADFKQNTREEFINEKHLDKQNTNHETNGQNNLMTLFILQPQWSLITKMLVLLGCIISVYIGHCATLIFGQLWSLKNIPAVPCPTITFSMYCIFLNVNSC